MSQNIPHSPWLGDGGGEDMTIKILCITKGKLIAVLLPWAKGVCDLEHSVTLDLAVEFTVSVPEAGRQRLPCPGVLLP